jgi:very-short-patch-repair endonuclease
MEELNIFTKNLDDLQKIFPNTQKIRITEFLKKNFKENIHFIIKQNVKTNRAGENRGGHNKIDYMFTEETFELIKNTYNLKYRYLTKINDNSIHVNILMNIENQTIGFIENSFKNVIDVRRQYSFGKYIVDLYFTTARLIVECDENNHKDRNENYEKEREHFILSQKNTIIRYNPNDKLFDLSLVLREINKILLKNTNIEYNQNDTSNHYKVIHVNFENNNVFLSLFCF